MAIIGGVSQHQQPPLCTPSQAATMSAAAASAAVAVATAAGGVAGGMDLPPRDLMTLSLGSWRGSPLSPRASPREVCRMWRRRAMLLVHTQCRVVSCRAAVGRDVVGHAVVGISGGV